VFDSVPIGSSERLSKAQRGKVLAAPQGDDVYLALRLKGRLPEAIKENNDKFVPSG